MALQLYVVNGKSNSYGGARIGYGGGVTVSTEDEWAERVKRIVRAEMVRRGVTYEGLSERLATIGVHDTPVNMRNKIARGKFTAVFFLQCLEAVGAETVRLHDA